MDDARCVDTASKRDTGDDAGEEVTGAVLVPAPIAEAAKADSGDGNAGESIADAEDVAREGGAGAREASEACMSGGVGEFEALEFLER